MIVEFVLWTVVSTGTGNFPIWQANSRATMSEEFCKQVLNRMAADVKKLGNSYNAICLPKGESPIPAR